MIPSAAQLTLTAPRTARGRGTAALSRHRDYLPPLRAAQAVVKAEIASVHGLRRAHKRFPFPLTTACGGGSTAVPRRDVDREG